MAAEESQQQSIQARIAALNMNHVGRAPITAQPAKRVTPPVPMKRSQTANIPTASTQSQDIGNQPAGPNGRDVLPPPEITRTGQKINGMNGTARVNGTPKPSLSLPPRTNTNGSTIKPVPPPRPPPRTETQPSAMSSPALPPRRPSELSRRDSQESIASTMSSMSALSSRSGRQPSVDGGRIRAPVYDPATLPPLPPKRTEEDKTKDLIRLPAKANMSTTSVIMNRFKPSSFATPTLPRRTSTQQETPIAPSRNLHPAEVPQLPPRRDTSQDPTVPPRPNVLPTPESTPPPVPSSTRPDLSKIMATKPKMPAPGPSLASDSCLLCRDFSAPDEHAAKFPRHIVPNIDWLATQLTQPFPSATDKARAIFTWLHHNVDYNVEAFFNDAVKPSTPASTLQTGLAVCEGYASLFAAIGTKAGLSCLVVCGHGKGYGFSAVKPGEPLPPPNPTGHAWSAVQIDGGEWKLIDACWGAGSVSGKNQPYSRHFTPGMFTYSNEHFGKTHFPENRAHFYRADGSIPTWEEYVLGDTLPEDGEPVQVYSDIAPKEGFGKFSFSPKQMRLSNSPSKGKVRFSFERECPHWDPLKHGPGKPYPYMLAMGVPPDGDKNRKPDYVGFNNNERVWWVDVDASRLGKSGDHIMAYAVTSIRGEDARGLTKADWEAAWGRTSMAWNGMARWEVA